MDPIIIEQSFPIQPVQLWQVITRPEHMRKWFFSQIEEFEPIKDFETSFTVVVEDRVYPHRWRLIEVEEYEIIRYDWSYDGYEGHSIVSFQLQPVDEGTKLVLTHFNDEPYDPNIPEFTRASGIKGWTYFIKESLVNYIQELESGEEPNYFNP